jgi:hypothetical protein
MRAAVHQAGIRVALDVGDEAVDLLGGIRQESAARTSRIVCPPHAGIVTGGSGMDNRHDPLE